MAHPDRLDDAQLLTAEEAANLLHVTPATLRTWEQAFGFPASLRSEHPAPTYLIAELLALQDALPDSLSITSVVHTTCRRIAESGVSEALS